MPQPRNFLHANALREITCVDCPAKLLGSFNRKRCDICRSLWRKKYSKARTRKVVKLAPKPTTLVSDRQVIAYLRAYMPEAYSMIIQKIEAMLPDPALKDALGISCAN